MLSVLLDPQSFRLFPGLAFLVCLDWTQVCHSATKALCHLLFLASKLSDQLPPGHLHWGHNHLFDRH